MDILNNRPNLTPQQAHDFAKSVFGIDAACKPLPSERDQNFLLRVTPDEAYVLKIAHGDEDHAMVEAQNALLLHLAARVDVCPHVVPTLTGDHVTTVTSINPQGGETSHCVRLLTFIEGKPLAQIGRHSAELMHDLGRAVGQVDNALLNFDHPALHYDFYWDLAQGLMLLDAMSTLLPIHRRSNLRPI